MRKASLFGRNEQLSVYLNVAVLHKINIGFHEKLHFAFLGFFSAWYGG